MPTIKMEHEVSEQFLKDCMTNAVESGGYCFWYWDGFTMINLDRDEDLNVTRIEFSSDDGNGEVVNVIIDTARVAEGIQKVLDDDAINDRIRGYIVSGVKDDEGGDIDAEACDVIMQTIAFGEVVYG